MNLYRRNSMEFYRMWLSYGGWLVLYDIKKYAQGAYHSCQNVVGRRLQLLRDKYDNPVKAYNQELTTEQFLRQDWIDRYEQYENHIEEMVSRTVKGIMNGKKFQLVGSNGNIMYECS
jgi:hypothetical protein